MRWLRVESYRRESPRARVNKQPIIPRSEPNHQNTSSRTFRTLAVNRSFNAVAVINLSSILLSVIYALAAAFLGAAFLGAAVFFTGAALVVLVTRPVFVFVRAVSGFSALSAWIEC